MGKFFKWLIRPLRERWVVSLIGIVILSLLIWFVGPLIAIAGYEPLAGAISRLVVILLLVFIWGMVNLLAIRRAKRANNEIAEGVVESADGVPAEDSAASEEEIQLLRGRLREAMATLRKAKLGGSGRRYLYQLPWYLIIGPPGAGKTTALKHSGLKFPLAEQFGKNAVHGVGGTRNCDWWFTDEAVLIDTAGRYTTQDSHQAADSAAWIGFLQLLRRYRRRRPVNGVIVAISIADLIGQTGAERKIHANAIKQRLQELREHLKVPFPVYVMFTKCDLVAGFVEHFEDFGREERAQVFGTTFPASVEGGADRFAEEFDALLARLDQRVATRLHQEHDVERRGLIHGFPRQMAGLGESLDRFLSDIFDASRFEERLMLRGFYFCSGTQEGNPIDRMMRSTASAFGLDYQALPAFSGQGRSYFLTRLLRDVIFREADIAGGRSAFDRYRAWIQRGAYAGAVLVTVSLALAWTASYFGNRQYIATVEENIGTYRKVSADLAAGDPVKLLHALKTLREIPGGYADRDADVPLLMGLGLYQGDKLGFAARNAYQKALNAALLPQLTGRLEDQLRANTDRPEYLYEALRVYLMLGTPSRLDPDVVALWMSLDWRNWFPGAESAEVREQLDSHVVAMLEGTLATPQLDAELVGQTREIVARYSLAERAFARMKQVYLADHAGDWRITDALGGTIGRVFQRASGKPLSEGVPGLFTREGFHDTFRAERGRFIDEVVGESWVLGIEPESAIGPDDRARIEEEMTTLYIDEYGRQWDAYLADLDIVEFHSVAQALDVLKLLSGVKSPIRGAVEAISAETMLVHPAIVDAEDGALAEVTSRLTTLLEEGGGLGQSADAPEAAINRKFAPLHAILRGEEGGPLPIDGVLNAVYEVYVYLSATADSASDAAKETEIFDRLRSVARVQPQPVANWLKAVARQSAAVTLRGVRENLNTVWTSTIAPYCRRALSNRYPLVKGSAQDTPLDDFAQLFGPGVGLDGFFTEYLRPFVDTSVQPWAWREESGADLGIPESVLRQFWRASVIRNTFFKGGAPRPNVSFSMKPVFLDDKVRQFLLEVGGQEVSYRHGPTRASRVQWPGKEGMDRARVVFMLFEGAKPLSITEDGPWAWFRLLDAAKVRPTSLNDKFSVTFEIDGRQAVYEIRADSVANPFRLKELQEFRCPESL